MAAEVLGSVRRRMPCRAVTMRMPAGGEERVEEALYFRLGFVAAGR